MSSQGEHCLAVLVGSVVGSAVLYGLMQGLVWAGKALEWRWLALDRTAFWLVFLLGPVVLYVSWGLLGVAWSAFWDGRFARRVRAQGLAALPELVTEIEGAIEAMNTFRLERELLPLLAELCGSTASDELRVLRAAIRDLDRARAPGPFGHGWELYGARPERVREVKGVALAALGRVVGKVLEAERG